LSARWPYNTTTEREEILNCQKFEQVVSFVLLINKVLVGHGEKAELLPVDNPRRKRGKGLVQVVF
jgi:hypothetical protein